jgi:uncharacterized membrane protein
MIPLLIGVLVVLCLSVVALAIVAVNQAHRLRELEGVVLSLKVEPAPAATDSEQRSYVPRQAVPRSLESIIGEKWLGWLAILLIFCAAAFFLKYAFENRWIGERGRVALEITAGLAFLAVGWDRHQKQWRYLAEVFTAGGITILYLSIYGAFGYYHLLDQRTAFALLALVVAGGHVIALSYRAPAIAMVALAGGFFVPVLLSTGSDQHAVLFAYIVLLDLGVLGAVIAREWRWIGSLAFLGTQTLFWGWYSEYYQVESRPAVLVFQAIVFVLFAAADLAPELRRRATGWEEWTRLAVNPFVSYGASYAVLNPTDHNWMGPLAILMAAIYAGLARVESALAPADRSAVLVTLGTALTLVTLAVPVQLESNWITIGWSLEALVLLWVAGETSSPYLRRLAGVVFGLAMMHFVLGDTPWNRAVFTPVVNRYFLGMLVLAACLGAAAWLNRAQGQMIYGLIAAAAMWLGSSVEAYTYFHAQAANVLSTGVPQAGETARQLAWAGQLALSVLWSVFAGLLMATGFGLRLTGLRLAGLTLFGITLLKVMLFDISELRQFYRILAFLALGLALLAVAWGYQRVRRA